MSCCFTQCSPCEKLRCCPAISAKHAVFGYIHIPVCLRLSCSALGRCLSTVPSDMSHVQECDFTDCRVLQARCVITTSQLARSLILTLLAIICGASDVTRSQGAAAAGGRPGTRTVRTADDFVAAFQDGVLHIVVAAHLDLTAVPTTLAIESKGYDFDRPLVRLNGTRSVRVRCPEVAVLAPALLSCQAVRLLPLSVLLSAVTPVVWQRDMPGGCAVPCASSTTRGPAAAALLCRCHAADAAHTAVLPV